MNRHPDAPTLPATAVCSDGDGSFATDARQLDRILVERAPGRIESTALVAEGLWQHAR
jgi:hypothetical protein